MIITGLYASLLAAAMSTFGIIAMALSGQWAQRYSAYCAAFAVGLLTVGVIFHLIPEAASISPMALISVPAGFGVMVMIGMIVETAVRNRPDGAALTFGYVSIIGLAAHSFLDGAVYAASFQENAFTGWLATSGLLLHEFPEGVIAYALLLQAGLASGRASILAFTAAALTTIAGTISAQWLFGQVNEPPIDLMLGSAAGALIYVLIFHLGPHARRTPNRRGYDLAMLGVITGTAALVVQQLSGTH